MPFIVIHCFQCISKHFISTKKKHLFWCIRRLTYPHNPWSEQAECNNCAPLIRKRQWRSNVRDARLCSWQTSPWTVLNSDVQRQGIASLSPCIWLQFNRTRLIQNGLSTKSSLDHKVVRIANANNQYVPNTWRAIVCQSPKRVL